MKTSMRKLILGAVFMAVLLTAGTGHADLVGYWSFDDPENLGHDCSGTGNNGLPVGGATPTTGVLGGAVHLNGSAYINVPDSPSLDLPGANGTISAFIRVSPSSDECGIVVKESSSSFPWTIAYEFTLRSDYLTMVTSNGSNIGYGSDFGAGLADSIWHHVAATWIPGDIRLYIDGVLVFQGNSGVPIYAIYNISHPVLIGAFRWNVGGEYRCMTGDIDEVRIYSHALSADEIRQMTNSPPVATITSPSSGFLAAVNTPVTFAGSIDDPDIGDTHTAVWTISSESGSEYHDGTVSGGSVNDSFQFSQAGIYSISLTVMDAAGESDTATTVNDMPAFIVVYDPSAGFVTGGGWIYSPAGSLLDSPAEGKATFGFVAKYKQGAAAPEGNTEFQFQAGDFRFKSSSYDWLVIAGSKAMFKGEGYIEGMGGGFKFMLTAVDSTEDKFRIKIWNPLTDDVIYDNKRGESDDGELTTIGGGSIVIHKK